VSGAWLIWSQKNTSGAPRAKSKKWRILILVGLGLVVTTTSGCTTSPSSAKPPVAAAFTPHEAFVDAKRAWVAGSYASSFEQSTYLLRAAKWLVHGVVPGAPADGRYRVSIRQLRQLASLPETSDTPQQKSEASSDLRTLNAFFSTKNLYD
jgi:hypothetical protein